MQTAYRSICHADAGFGGTSTCLHFQASTAATEPHTARWVSSRPLASWKFRRGLAGVCVSPTTTGRHCARNRTIGNLVNLCVCRAGKSLGFRYETLHGAGRSELDGIPVGRIKRGRPNIQLDGSDQNSCLPSGGGEPVEWANQLSVRTSRAGGPVEPAAIQLNGRSVEHPVEWALS